VTQIVIILCIVYWSYYLTAVVFLSTLRSVPAWGTRTNNASIIALTIIDAVELEKHPVDMISDFASAYVNLTLFLHRVLLVSTLLQIFILARAYIANQETILSILPYYLIGFGLFCVVWLVFLRKRTLS